MLSVLATTLAALDLELKIFIIRDGETAKPSGVERVSSYLFVSVTELVL